MSNKLTFEEWFFQCGFHKDGYDCSQVSSAQSAWKFCQAQEQKEYKLLEAEHSILLAQFSKVDVERLRLEKANVALMDERDIIRKENDSLWVESEDLTRKIEKLEQEVARLKEENLRMRNCMSCKHSSMLGNCLHPNHPATLNCRCNLWEIKG